MMTVDGFRQYVAGEAKKGIPFIAYWYPRGFGLLRTGPFEDKKPVYYLYLRDKKKPETYADAEELTKAVVRARKRGEAVDRTDVKEKIKTIKPRASTIKAFRREAERLAEKAYPVYFVEFDGRSLSTTGGLEL